MRIIHPYEDHRLLLLLLLLLLFCTMAAAVAVIVTVMYPLWTHAMTVVIAIDNVDPCPCFAVPSRHGLRGVASHQFALALPRLSRHGLHGVASHHFALALALAVPLLFFCIRFALPSTTRRIVSWAEPV